MTLPFLNEIHFSAKFFITKFACDKGQSKVFLAISAGPVEMWAGIGQSATFTCATAGDRPSTINWYKVIDSNNVTVNTGRCFTDYLLSILTGDGNR